MNKLITIFWKNRINGRKNLIVLFVTVILSGMAVFGGISLLPVMKIVIRNNMKRSDYGCATFFVLNPEGDLFSLSGVRVKEGNAVGCIFRLPAKTEEGDINLKIYGMEYDDYRLLYGSLPEPKLKHYMGETEAILSESFAREAGVAEGDRLAIKISSVFCSVRVMGIVEDQQMFNGEKHAVLIPRRQLQGLLGVEEDAVSMVFITGCESKEQIQFAEEQSLTEVGTERLIEERISLYAVCMFVILVFVFLIAFYICFNAYNIMILERCRFIGICLSCGAGRKKIKWLFFRGNILIPAAGASVSCLLMTAFIQLWLRIQYGINYVKTETAYFVLAVLISILFLFMVCESAMLVSLSKYLNYSDRALILNSAGTEGRRAVSRELIWILIFAVVCLCAKFMNSGNAACEILFLVLLILFSVLSIRSVFYLAGSLLEQKTGSGRIQFVSKTLVNDVYARKNLLILVVLFVSTTLISSMTVCVMEGFVTFYNNYKCNVSVEPSVLMKEEELERLNQFETLTAYYPCNTRKFTLDDSVTVAGYVEKEPDKLSEDFLEFHITWGRGYKRKFKEDRYCVISRVYAKNKGLTIGDQVRITRGGRTAGYEIAAISDSTYNTGQFVIISPGKIPFDNIGDYNLLLCQSEDPEGLRSELESTFPEIDFSINKISYWLERDIKNNRMMIYLLYGFIVFIFAIGIQGISNNIRLGLLNRKRSFAVLLSVGHTFRDIIYNLVLELLLCGVGAGVYSAILVTMYKIQIEKIMVLLNFALPFDIRWSIAVMMIILCILVLFVMLLSFGREIRKECGRFIELLKMD